jgi:hypothetical protein
MIIGMTDQRIGGDTASAMTWNECPSFWREITRPSQSSRFRQQSKLQS